jgi:hypothetical protein
LPRRSGPYDRHGVIAIFLAVNAERRSLEDIARPFTAARDRLVRQPKAAAVRAR